jgi:uncharacterized membrane protein YfcA
VLFALLFAAGASVGFLSGLLGIGGGIVLFPLLVYAPPALGLGALDVKSITGLTMTQGFFASLSAVVFYQRHRLVNRRLVLVLGLSLFASSLGGALFSGRAADRTILLVFGVLAVAAAAMMLLPRAHGRDELTEERVRFNAPLAVGVGLPLGFLLGMLGQGGAFIIIPVMLYVLKIPLRVALGSMLAIGLFSATAGLAGKVATGQVPFLPALAMLVGAVPFARLGGIAGKSTDVRHLRWLLAVVILLSALKIWSDIFGLLS